MHIILSAGCKVDLVRGGNGKTGVVWVREGDYISVSRSMRADVCLVNTNRHRWADMLPCVSVDYSKELLRNHSALLYQST